MFYGLGTNFEYFNEHLRDVIMVAPCVYEESTYEEIVHEYLPLQQNGEYFSGGPGQDSEAAPYKSMMYTMQNYAEDQFKEPISIEDYANGQRDSPVIDLGVVDNTLPITLIIGTEDGVCTPPLAERIFKELSNADVTKRYEEGYDHGKFTWIGSKDFVDRMVATIEKGGHRHQKPKPTVPEQPSGECFDYNAYYY